MLYLCGEVVGDDAMLQTDPPGRRGRRTQVTTASGSAQAATIARVVKARTRPASRFIVLGDMNDGVDAATLPPMIAGLELTDALLDVVESRPPSAVTNPEDAPPSPRGTHCFPRTGVPDLYELEERAGG